MKLKIKINAFAELEEALEEATNCSSSPEADYWLLEGRTKKWFSDGGIITVEIDTVEGTAKVLEVKK